jgi:hypothetical protein
MERARRGLNDGHGTGDGERRRSSLVRVQGERARLRAQVSRGKWASGVRGQKGQGREEVAGECADVGTSTTGTWARG